MRQNHALGRGQPSPVETEWRARRYFVPGLFLSPFSKPLLSDAEASWCLWASGCRKEQEALMAWGCFSFWSIFDMYLSYSHSPRKTSIFPEYSEVFVFSTTNTWSKAFGHNLPVSPTSHPCSPLCPPVLSPMSAKISLYKQGLQKTSISSLNNLLKCALGSSLESLCREGITGSSFHGALPSFHLSTCPVSSVSFHLFIKTMRSLNSKAIRMLTWMLSISRRQSPDRVQTKKNPNTYSLQCHLKQKLAAKELLIWWVP